MARKLAIETANGLNQGICTGTLVQMPGDFPLAEPPAELAHIRAASDCRRALLAVSSRTAAQRAEFAVVGQERVDGRCAQKMPDRKSTRLNSSHANISYAVFCLK